MESVKTYIGQIEYDTNLYAVLSAIIAVLLTIVIFYFLKRKTVQRRNVLITGLSDAGKTALFSRLVASKKVVTYTSMKENVAMFRIDKKKYVTIVDIPGNDRLRAKYLEEFLPTARGIIFVIDSLNFPREIRDVAGFLFILLQEPLVHRYKIPFLIACNKQDHAVSKSAKVIQSQLEKEMNTLRVTQTGRLASTSASEEFIFLGSKSKVFQFSDIRNIKFDFINCSAEEFTEDNIEISLKPWLSRIA